MAKKRNHSQKESSIKNQPNETLKNTKEASSFDVEEKNKTYSQDLLNEIKSTLEEGNYRNTKSTAIDYATEDGADAEVYNEEAFAKTKEKRRKKTKKTYEHTTFAHKMRVLAVLLVLGIFTGSGLGVWYFNFELRTDFNPFDYIAADYIQDINYTFEKNNISATTSQGLGWVEIAKNKGLTPADLTPADNYVLAEYNTSIANSYLIDGYGLVVAMGQDQKITSRKKKKGNVYTFESISPAEGLIANFVSDIILCDKYTANTDYIELYSSKSTKPNKGDWKRGETLSKEDYANLSGGLPNTISAYIVSEKTVNNNKKENVIYNKEDDTYTFTMKLNKQLSVINYAKQVKRTGGLGSYPEFEFINFTATIDSDWNLISFTIEEQYKAVKGISVICKGKLDYAVTINNEIELPV